MSKTVFAKLILDKIEKACGTDSAQIDSITALNAQKAIASAITEYITSNTKVQVLYNGTMNAGGGPDMANDVMMVSGSISDLPIPSDFNSWVMSIQTAIASSFSVMSPGTQGVIVQMMPFNPITGVFSVSQNDMADTFKSSRYSAQAVWEVVCDSIINWIGSASGKNPNAISLPATRSGVSTGTASLTAITID